MQTSTAAAMRAIRIHSYGTPDVMRLEELPMPQPGAGEVRVRTEAASVNFIDIQKRRGELTGQAFYKKGGMNDDLPTAIGSQGIGVVDAIGEGVDTVAIGTRVNFYGSSYATHAVVPAARVVPVPAAFTLEQAAAGLTQGFLAYELTHAAYPVQSGERCLVQAAAGGIGLFICQMIKIRGGKVIAVTSSASKAQTVREAGADEVIISTEADIATEVRRITDGCGVRVVYDGVGKDTFDAGINSLAPRGYMIVYGQASGYIPPLDIMLLQEKGSLYISRNSAGFYIDEFPNYLRDMVGWVQQGKISIKVDSIYPLADAAKAHEAVEQRRVSGRVLLMP